MKLASAICLTVFCATYAYGEIQVAAETKRAIPPIEAGRAVWIRCGACAPPMDAVRVRFTQAGYRVVGDDEADAADVRVIFVNGVVSIPIEGGARNVDIDSIPSNVGPIQPALAADQPNADAGSPGPGARGIDGAIVKSGAGLTGSSSGGMLVGLAAARFADWLGSRQADATRTAGIGRLSVRLIINGENNGFGLTFAATTPETPEALIDAAYKAVLIGLQQGLPAGRSFPLAVSH